MAFFSLFCYKMKREREGRAGKKQGKMEDVRYSAGKGHPSGTYYVHIYIYMYMRMGMESRFFCEMPR